MSKETDAANVERIQNEKLANHHHDEDEYLAAVWEGDHEYREQLRK